MKRFRGIVFDFDGTLATLTINFQRMKRKVALLGSIFLEEDQERLLKSPLPVLEFVEEITQRIKKLNKELAKEFNTRCRLMMVDMEIKAAQRGKLFPYTREIISKLKKQGIRVGIITRNCTPAVMELYPQIKEEVGVFLPREDVERVKPSPDHLLKALSLLGTSPEESLYVGDHPIDIECAKRAKTWSGAVLSGIGKKEELLRYKPDFLTSNIAELYKNLSEIGGI